MLLSIQSCLKIVTTQHYPLILSKNLVYLWFLHPICSIVWYRADFDITDKFLLSLNFSVTVSQLDVNSAASAILDALHTSVLRYVTCVKFTSSKVSNWFLNELIIVVFQKKKAHLIYKNF